MAVGIESVGAIYTPMLCGLLSANWDGIHDNETGILMYTWAVGTSPCGDDIVSHNDPHEHIASVSEWTNVGLAFPLNLPGNTL